MGPSFWVDRHDGRNIATFRSYKDMPSHFSWREMLPLELPDRNVVFWNNHMILAISLYIMDIIVDNKNSQTIRWGHEHS